MDMYEELKKLWATGFSESKFSDVRMGMSQTEVMSLLGIPLQMWTGSDGCTWLYTWQDTPTADYDRRWVSFDSKGFVDEVNHEFYID
jgi:outer membrane protein assembly factor BamE (lipoprotein component of BamABCDE complex)